MGLTWTNCPNCESGLTRSTKIVEGATVVRCGSCRRYWLEGDSYVVTQGDPEGSRDADYVVGLLEARHAVLSAFSEEARTAALIESDITDPRWEQIV
jgi:hypothetical protein